MGVFRNVDKPDGSKSLTIQYKSRMVENGGESRHLHVPFQTSFSDSHTIMLISTTRVKIEKPTAKKGIGRSRTKIKSLSVLARAWLESGKRTVAPWLKIV